MAKRCDRQSAGTETRRPSEAARTNRPAEARSFDELLCHVLRATQMVTAVATLLDCADAPHGTGDELIADVIIPAATVLHQATDTLEWTYDELSSMPHQETRGRPSIRAACVG